MACSEPRSGQAPEEMASADDRGLRRSRSSLRIVWSRRRLTLGGRAGMILVPSDSSPGVAVPVGTTAQAILRRHFRSSSRMHIEDAHFGPHGRCSVMLASNAGIQPSYNSSLHAWCMCARVWCSVHLRPRTLVKWFVLVASLMKY